MLGSINDGGPDLHGAMRWFELAWSNSFAVQGDMRVMALRAGFDSLFPDQASHEIRAQLSQLLDFDSTERVHRQWTTTRGKTYTDYLTPLGWWFANFVDLRNRIAHKGNVDPIAYDFEGISHIDRAEWILRTAIKRFVADAGHPELLFDVTDRAMRALALANEPAEPTV